MGRLAVHDRRPDAASPGAAQRVACQLGEVSGVRHRRQALRLPSESMSTDTWTMVAAIGQIAGAVITAILAVGTYIAARAEMLSARTAEREFRASRQPILSLKWEGPTNPIIESAIFSGCIESSAPVVIWPITLEATPIGGTVYEVSLVSSGIFYAKPLKAHEELRFTITVTALDAIPGIEEIETWYCESVLELLPGAGGPMLIMTDGPFQRRPVAKRSRGQRLRDWLHSIAEPKRGCHTRRGHKWNPLGLRP